LARSVVGAGIVDDEFVDDGVVDDRVVGDGVDGEADEAANGGAAFLVLADDAGVDEGAVSATTPW
jgi:hypothetical protein